MLVDARREQPAAEASLRHGLGDRHPDTKHFLAMVPGKGDLPSAASVLEKASGAVLEALSRLARLCVVSGLTALEYFHREMAGLEGSDLSPKPQEPKAPAPAPQAAAAKASAPKASVRRKTAPCNAPFIDDDGQVDIELYRIHQIRGDLGELMNLIVGKLRTVRGKAWEIYRALYDRVLPGGRCFLCHSSDSSCQSTKPSAANFFRALSQLLDIDALQFKRGMGMLSGGCADAGVADLLSGEPDINTICSAVELMHKQMQTYELESAETKVAVDTILQTRIWAMPG